MRLTLPNMHLGSSMQPAGPSAPVADFTIDVDEGNDPLLVTATNLSSGLIDTYLWEKNDGGGWVEYDDQPDAENPEEYFEEGTWSIRLTVTGPGGSHSKTLTDAVVVYGPLFQATFTGANGTNLSGYSPEVGDIGTLLAGTRFEIQGNQAASVDSAATTRAMAFEPIDTLVSDIVLTGSAKHSNGYTGFFVRGTDINNSWWIVMAGGAFTQEVRIFKREGGSLTSLANQNAANNTSTLYPFSITANGQSISLNWNSGGASISYNSASFQETATQFGLIGADNNDRWDTLTVWRHFA